VIDTVIITCEHGGNRIPAPYRPLFRGMQAQLATHRGFDHGALVMARALAGAFKAPLISSTVSRLLIDLNRSIGHPQLYSPITRRLPATTRAQIVEQHYRPYRTQVEAQVTQAVSLGQRLIHISSHSFTPALDSRIRTADVGLLYDPRRRGEVALCERWQAALHERAPALRVRRNYPYAGKGDGLTSHLRRHFSPSDYIGIELEVNQAIVADRRRWAQLRRALIYSLHTTLSGAPS
jgi:predicted N-formylglutamate amidohydrolase